MASVLWKQSMPTPRFPARISLDRVEELRVSCHRLAEADAELSHRATEALTRPAPPPKSSELRRHLRLVR